MSLRIATVLLLSPAFLFSQTPEERLFTLLLPEQTGVQFVNRVEPSDRLNIIKYLYFYNGGGVAVGDLNNDALPDLYFTANQLPDRLYLNKGNLQFEDITEQAGIIPSSNSSWKTGVTFADVNADGWLDIYVCEVGFYKSINGQNRLFINNGSMQSQIPSPQPPTSSHQSPVTSHQSPITFTERASEYGLYFKGFAQQSAFFDYDLDGDLDCFLLTHSTHSASTYVKAEKRTERDSVAGDFLLENIGYPPQGGAGGVTFVDISEKAGIYGGSMGYGLGLVAADLNNDGFPDIYVTNDFHENDYLYLNNGDGTFSEIIAEATGHNSTFSMGVDAADCNNDGLLDLLTLDMRPPGETLLKASGGNDHYNLQQMKLGYGYHHQYPRNCLQLASPQPTISIVGGATSSLPSAVFSEVGQQAGIAATDWSWAGLFADLDNDGWKDIFITNGIPRRPNDLDYLKFGSSEAAQRLATDRQLGEKMPSGEAANYAFRNAEYEMRNAEYPDTASGRIDTSGLKIPHSAFRIPHFKDVSAEWGLDLFGCSNGAAYADLDNDGDLDLIVNNLNAPASIYRNNAEKLLSHNFLKIRLKGEGGNPFGVGAKVTLRANGVTQTQELSPVRGWQSSVDYVLNFGLGEALKIDSLEVRWLGGKRQILTDVSVNQTLTLRQENAATSGTPTFRSEPPTSDLKVGVPEISTSDLKVGVPENPPPLINHQSPIINHAENRFNDFNVEPLMPHQLSTQGPKMAVGKDGWLYLCGAKAQAGQLFRLTAGEEFEKSPQPAFDAAFLCEDVDATFFDADLDGDEDLWVVSGGSEYREGATQLRDRLYLNDGQDHFQKQENGLPDISVNGACIEVGDFNGDGFPDLFRGGRSVPGSYGLSPRSFILLNDGKGNFRDATEEICPEIAHVGMVTDAVWLPGERRLAVIGEWMPLTIFDLGMPDSIHHSSFIIHHSSFIIHHSEGWWNTLAAADPDGDGDLDLLAGNLGLNSNLNASPQEPLELYVKDFDENGATDPVMTYYRQGKKYCYSSRDELTGQLTFLKKAFPDYAKYARSTFPEVFDETLLANAVHQKAETLASAYFENLGEGNFHMTPLPAEAQTAPIFAFLPGDFDGDGKQDALAVGNWYAQHPSTGRLDASQGWFLKGDAQGGFVCLPPSQSGFFVQGEGRDLKRWGSWFLVARNQGELMMFELNGK